VITPDDFPALSTLRTAQRDAGLLLRRITHPEPEPDENTPDTAPDQEEQQS
jgi:hypothetical protein